MTLPVLLRKKWVLAGSALLLCVIGFFLLVRPSHDRDWELGQERLPRFVRDGDTLRVENFRNFPWTGEMESIVRYETRSFDLASVQTLDVFISHFDDFEGLAHIFLSFGFSDGEYLVVSLESRREVGEEFSPILGLFRQYEIIYVVGSEEDLVGARVGVRNERVYRYPTVATPDQARALLLRFGEDINSVYEEPRFYHTLLHNCTNELTRRVEEMSQVDFPLSWKSVLPGYFDEVLYEMGLIQKVGSFADTKVTRFINSATINPRSAHFSRDLRQ
ncbi:MAG: DUF4105 domain-containing protein [Candidatus Moranbacteria bacterium]|nr:DUF4105 domain-containing protein [Candidatus Moranbacteria bacterium]